MFFHVFDVSKVFESLLGIKILIESRLRCIEIYHDDCTLQYDTGYPNKYDVSKTKNILKLHCCFIILLLT